MNTPEIRKLINLMESYNNPILNEAFPAKMFVDEIASACSAPIASAYGQLSSMLREYIANKKMGQRVSSFKLAETGVMNRWMKTYYELEVKPALYYIVREHEIKGVTEPIRMFLRRFAGVDPPKYKDVFEELLPLIRNYARFTKHDVLVDVMNRWVQLDNEYQIEKSKIDASDKANFGMVSMDREKRAKTVDKFIGGLNTNNAPGQYATRATSTIKDYNQDYNYPDSYEEAENAADVRSIRAQMAAKPKSAWSKVEEPVEKPLSAQEKALLGQQNAAANAQVNQILKMLPPDVAGDIRQEIARSPNKLLSLRAAFKKRGINMQ